MVHRIKAKKKSNPHLAVQKIWDDFIRNIVDFFEEPTWGTFIGLTIDISSYYVMPFQGGYTAALAH